MKNWYNDLHVNRRKFVIEQIEGVCSFTLSSLFVFLFAMEIKPQVGLIFGIVFLGLFIFRGILIYRIIYTSGLANTDGIISVNNKIDLLQAGEELVAVVFIFNDVVLIGSNIYLPIGIAIDHTISIIQNSVSYYYDDRSKVKILTILFDTAIVAYSIKSLL